MHVVKIVRVQLLFLKIKFRYKINCSLKLYTKYKFIDYIENNI